MNLTDQLKRDEGLRLKVYRDTKGISTIGYGCNLAAHKMWVTSCTQQQAEQWLVQDITHASSELAEHLPWTSTLDEARRGVLINMTFNMGIDALLEFHHTLEMVKQGQYELASTAMLQSLWARQVGGRAQRLAEQMKTGVWV